MLRKLAVCIYLFFIVSLLFAVTSCKSKKGDDTSNVAPPVPISPIALPGSAVIQGLPSNPSRVTQLSVAVTGANLSGYRFALVSDSTLCDNVGLSELREGSQLITENLGSDGTKTLCIAALTKEDSNEKVSSFSYTWLKDTAPPDIIFPALRGTGPNIQQGSDFAVSLQVIDALSALTGVTASFSDGEKCLNASNSQFSGSCPLFSAVPKIAGDTYQISIPKNLLTGGRTYRISVRAVDLAGNTQAVASTFDISWDTSPPAAVAALTATASQQQVSLSWPAVADAESYVVIKKAWSVVDVTPIAGSTPVVGGSVGNENYVACSQPRHPVSTMV